MKRLIALICSFAILAFTVGPYPVFAVEHTDYNDLLSSIALEYIDISTDVSFGSETITYSNLQEFYHVASTYIPSIADVELAEFIVDYTGQQEAAKHEEIETILAYDEIIQSTQLFEVASNERGNTLSSIEPTNDTNENIALPYAFWESDDGYIAITTSSTTLTSTVDGTPYVLYAKAEWLKMPLQRFTDTIAITYTGAVDDTYVMTATFRQESYCAFCKQTVSINESESYGPNQATGNTTFITNAEHIELDYSQANAIGAKIDILTQYCYHVENGGPATNFAGTTRMESTLRIKVLVDSLGESRSAYIHTFLGASISVSGSVSGNSVTPSVSGAISWFYEDYVAAPITLRVS